LSLFVAFVSFCSFFFLMKGKRAFLILAVAVLVLDQAAKVWAIRSLKAVGSIEVIPGFFRLSYAVNRGVAFSLFADSQFDLRWVLAAVSALAAVLVVVYLVRFEGYRPLMGVSLALLLSGIVGNLIDRIRLGEVIDFLDFHLGERFTWPIFNVADSAICIGAALLAIELLREERREPNPATKSIARASEDLSN
jgi:signal peptidase II